MHRLPIIYTFLTILVLSLSSFTKYNTNIKNPINKNKLTDFEIKAEVIYGNLNPNNLNLPKLESFTKALKGFYELKTKGMVQKEILTLIDFSLPSTSKRLWVIDLNSNKVLFNSLVAHGMKTGGDMANNFSNDHSSFKSSLGFYTTGETYNGKHGMSLRLDGLEKGLNSNARARGVVMHSAAYVSEAFIRQNKRLGRSQGCPALPKEVTKDIINIIKNKSCLFIYHPSLNSKFLQA